MTNAIPQSVSKHETRIGPALLRVAVAAAMVMALPLAAQNTAQDGSQSYPYAANAAQVQTGTSTAQTTNAELGKYDPQYATGQPLQTQSHEGFWGHMNPFARKKWVNRQVGPVKDRLNELDQLTASNAQQIKDLDARTRAGIQQANAAAQLADSHATQAGNTATQAQQLAQQASSRTGQINSAVSNMDQYQAASQVEIRFRSGQTVLGDNARSALDQIASQLHGQRGYLIEVQGHSSLRGQAGLDASRRMAAAVTRYLVLEHQVPLYRIRQIGLGNTPVGTQDAETHYHGTIVEVNVMHNSLSALSAPPMGGPPIGATQPTPAQSSSNGVASQPVQP
jgi:outer membrane protein OmpA-like peptidoglycan-associated protein